MKMATATSLMGFFLASVVFMGETVEMQGSAAAGKATDRKRPVVRLTEEARRIHRETLLIDGHNDLPWQVRIKANSSFQELDISQRLTERGLHTDIPRLRQGDVGAQFWAAYVPAETMQTGGAARYCLEQIDLIHRMVRRYPETFEMADSADEVIQIRRRGKIACLIGIEGGQAIENSLGSLRMFYRLGARYMTLTHSGTLDWADSATDEPRNGGLSPFGEEVVREMNRLGMLVDISHVSADTMCDVLRVSRAPVIASHSSAFAIAPHPRNVPDDVLRLMAENGGVVMVNFYSGFVVPEAAGRSLKRFDVIRELRARQPDEAAFQQALESWEREHPMVRGTIHDVVDHIDHIVKVAGIDHVGLGSDYDGVGTLPEQLEDVSCFPFITQELLNRGYSREEIHKILGGNVLRALHQAEVVAHCRVE